MQNDFLENRQNYRTAKRPLIKGKIYFNRCGERVKYCSTDEHFDNFKWADKPNVDGQFMVSWVYEKKETASACCFAPLIENIRVCSKCKERSELVDADD